MLNGIDGPIFYLIYCNETLALNPSAFHSLSQSLDRVNACWCFGLRHWVPWWGRRVGSKKLNRDGLRYSITVWALDIRWLLIFSRQQKIYAHYSAAFINIFWVQVCVVCSCALAYKQRQNSLNYASNRRKNTIICQTQGFLPLTVTGMC